MRSTYDFRPATVLVLLTLGSPLRSEPVTGQFDDLRKVPAANKLLEQATSELKKFAQGNEGGVSIKSAQAKDVVFDLQTGMPTSGIVTIVFDIHHRHRISQDGWIIIKTPFGDIKTFKPGIVAYDNHHDAHVEYDIKAGRGKARVAKGPIDLPLIPKIDWDLWIHFDGKK